MKQQFVFLLTYIFGFAFISQAQEITKKDTAKTLEVFPQERMPEFPGGTAALYNFVSKNKHYKDKDKPYTIGMVYLTFVIEKDGSIGDSVKVLKSNASEYYNNEAIRIVKAMPKWIPGSQNGEPVSVQFNLPIKF